MSNKTYADEQLALYYAGRQGPYTICGNSGNTVVFLSLSEITHNFEPIIALAESYSPEAFYPHDTDPSIIAGYKAQRHIIFGLYTSKATSVQETDFNSGNSFPLTLVKPLSRGIVLINSTDPLSASLID